VPLGAYLRLACRAGARLAKWCGVSEDEFRAALFELRERYRVIERLPEKAGRAWQWVPVLKTQREGGEI
jgi:hypothetical protein